MKPLDDGDRDIAEAAARVIATCAEANVPDLPPLTPSTIGLIARAHVELCEMVRTLHRAHFNTNLERRPPDGTSAEQIAAGVHDVARQAFLGGAAWAHSAAFKAVAGRNQNEVIDEAFDQWRAVRAERRALHIVPTSAQLEEMSTDQLLALYCHVMREVAEVFVKYESYVVRLWDGMDGCWTNCTDEVSRGEALHYWAWKTAGGEHHVSYAEIDYYRIFPGGTHMHWDGSEGREMHR